MHIAEAKLMTTFYPLDKLRKIKGMESAKYIDPYAGGKGNSIRYLSVAPRTDDMRVKGIDNLFVGGEKSGLFVGHTEARHNKLQQFIKSRGGIFHFFLGLPQSLISTSPFELSQVTVSTMVDIMFFFLELSTESIKSLNFNRV